MVVSSGSALSRTGKCPITNSEWRNHGEAKTEERTVDGEAVKPSVWNWTISSKRCPPTHVIQGALSLPRSVLEHVESGRKFPSDLVGAKDVVEPCRV